MKKALLLMIALTSSALAQRLEITPFAAYRWGGQIDHDQSAIDTDLDVEHNGSFGLVVELPLVRDFGGQVPAGLNLELSAARQGSELTADPGLFAPGSVISDLDVTYYHGGLVLQMPMQGFSPFLALSAGFTTLEPDGPELEDETRFSGSFGAGAKVWVARNVGFRFEFRGFATSLGEDEDVQCGDFNCGEYYDAMNQAEARLGLIVSF